VTPPVLTFSYKTTSLVGSPSFVLSPTITINSAATSGTVTLVGGTVTDVIGYTLNTTTGVLAPASPYTVAGDLRQAALMVCKPANTVAGNIFGEDVYFKAIYVGLPATATPGSIDDLKGKTFDIYDNCQKTFSVVFDASANGTFFSGTTQLRVTPAASIANLLRPEGVIDTTGTAETRTDTVDQYRVFKSDAKVILVTRRLILQPLKNVDNTNGELAAWFSR
jgi:hypothetical protein